MTDLFFCPERWEPDESVSTNEAVQIKVHGYSGRTTEAWQIGSWDGGWTAITSHIPLESGWLEAGGEYRFCFWLNGGENSRADEVCTLEIFGDAWEERLTFRLNRNHTRPLLTKDGWLLFGIPFTAPQAASALNFRFVAANAVCTIAGIPDMEMSRYETVSSDPPDTEHAQRHNIVYPGGWPVPKKKKVVLKTPRRQLELSHTALRIAGAVLACTAVGLAVAAHTRKKENR